MPIARQLLNHSLVCTETMAITAGSFSTLSSGFQLLVPLPAPIPEGSSFPGGPGGLWGGKAWGRHFLSPSLLLPPPPRPSWKTQRQDWKWSQLLGFGEGTWLAEPLPSPDPEQCKIQGADPNCKQLPPSSKRTSPRGRAGKGSERRRPRCQGGFNFFPLSVFLSRFCFTASPPHNGYMNWYVLNV